MRLTGKPTRLKDDLLPLCGQTVLDPFMGSGTTGVACGQPGRRIEEEYRVFDQAPPAANEP